MSPLEDIVNAYLDAEVGTDVRRFAEMMAEQGVYPMIDPCKGINVTWECEATDVTEFKLEYATEPDYSDALAVSVSHSVDSVELFNLYKGTHYYLRLTAKTDGNKTYIAESEFDVADKGPRAITVEGIHNVRDVGGYTTVSGKRTLQGIFYRGSEMDGTHGIALTQNGNDYMSNVLKIKHDIDLRSASEAENVTQSPISSATHDYYTMKAYAAAFDAEYKDANKKIYKALADKSNYPVYMHCWGGADRTGTVCYIVNAMLGVKEEDLIHDFEFTTFSVFVERNTKGDDFKAFKTEFDKMEGNTAAEKAESYLLWLGLSIDEIDGIRAIMFGEK